MSDKDKKNAGTLLLGAAVLVIGGLWVAGFGGLLIAAGAVMLIVSTAALSVSALRRPVQ